MDPTEDSPLAQYLADKFASMQPKALEYGFAEASQVKVEGLANRIRAEMKALGYPIVALPAKGHDPCVVLQTSRGHLQAWVRVSRTPLEATVATAISKYLARTYGGDLASTDGPHLGRLAGFTIRSPSGAHPTATHPG